ncbi:methylglyoxal synthase [Halomonas urumqiensis]|uniref:Methylglyoxal synthase n=1 Tax=Halomonas urumqiensis TaxID=1684789 RepID=A0A2N7UNY0_9GAMM|nr:methylglyoxal synthase [Halomonas urumqiensis]PMR82153.1 methylglyoxal synthase [Halomonas urumqiensis]PTB02516.1 methylglyoxal synthase [Halomonas urumqiensis]GHE20988.1 methylglyoxal synthase [Halomonas urumqiensis]
MTDIRPRRNVQRTLPARKRIALIAHDGKKEELLEWAERWRDTLAQHELTGTGTTAKRVAKRLSLPIQGLMSGPLGGDQQIGALITEQNLDLLIFFWDPFSPQPHDPDVKALLRLAALWNVPVACNAASADFLISSPLLGEDYQMSIPDAGAWISERVAD